MEEDVRPFGNCDGCLLTTYVTYSKGGVFRALLQNSGALQSDISMHSFSDHGPLTGGLDKMLQTAVRWID